MLKLTDPNVAIPEIADALASWSEARRHEAADVLDSLPPERNKEIVTALIDEVGRLRGRGTLTRLCFTVGAPVMVMAVPLVMVLAGTAAAVMPTIIILAAIYPLTRSITATCSGILMCLEQLARIEDSRAMLVLIDALDAFGSHSALVSQIPFGHRRRSKPVPDQMLHQLFQQHRNMEINGRASAVNPWPVTKALAAMLARYNPQCDPEIDPMHRAILRARVQLWANHLDVLPEAVNELVIGILSAWSQIGDTKELAVVQRLTDRAGDSTFESPIRAAAQTCETAILQRLERNRSQATLLRPAVSTETDLLRPAEGVDSDSNMLLRAGEAPRE